MSDDLTTNVLPGDGWERVGHPQGYEYICHRGCTTWHVYPIADSGKWMGFVQIELINRRMDSIKIRAEADSPGDVVRDLSEELTAFGEELIACATWANGGDDD